MKVFISYGRQPQEYVDLVKKFHQDLVQHGFDVWIDDQLKKGLDWEIQLEMAIKSNEKFLYFMTDHATRRPDGYCLNEVSFALIHNKSIIPVMVEAVSPPLSICRLQHFDMMSLLPKKEVSEEKYNDVLSNMISVLRGEKELGELECENDFYKSLKIMDFASKEKSVLKRFVGREWIYDYENPSKESEISRWLSIKNNKAFLLLGDPGIGKSAIAAYLINRHPDCKAYHFCIKGDPDTKNPILFINSIAKQLATQIPKYKDFLINVSKESISDSPASRFRELIANPLSKISLEQDFFIVIDALDEATENFTDNSILEMLSRDFLESLPDKMRFIITSRNDSNIQSRFEIYRPYIIDAKSKNNKNDIKKLIEDSLKNIDISADPEQIDIFVERSEGNMLYISLLIKKLEMQNIKTLTDEIIPDGLDDYYLTNLKELYRESEDFAKSTQYKIFAIVIASWSPLSAKQLADILDKRNIRADLELINDYLLEDDQKKLYFFHKSFRDWLTNDANTRFWTDQNEGHKSIISFYPNLEDVEELERASYSRFHLWKEELRRRNFSDQKHYAELVKLLGRLDNETNEALIKELHKQFGEINSNVIEELQAQYDDIKMQLKELMKPKESRLLTETKAQEEALRAYKENPKRYAEDYTRLLNNLASSYYYQNRPDEAIALQEESLKILKELYQTDSQRWAEDYINSLNNLASSYYDQDRPDEAIALYEESFKILTPLYSTDPEKWEEDYTKSLNNLASSYKNQNRLDEAISLQEQSLKILKELYQTNPDRWAEDYTKSLNNLASSYKNQNRLDEAIALEEDSLKILRELYQTNPDKWAEDYTRLLSSLATSYKNQNRPEEAKALKEKYLKIRKECYQANPDKWAMAYARSLNDLVISYKNQNRLDEAIAFEEESLKIRKEFGVSNWSDALDYITSLNNLATSYYMQNRPEEAIALQEQSFNVCRNLYQSNSSEFKLDYITSLNSLANSYKNQNRLDEAIALEEESLKILKERYQANPQRWTGDYTNTLHRLASSKAKSSDFERASQLFSEYFDIYDFETNSDIRDFIYPFVKWYQCEQRVQNHEALKKLDKLADDHIKIFRSFYKEEYSSLMARVHEGYLPSKNSEDKVDAEKYEIFVKIFMSDDFI